MAFVTAGDDTYQLDNLVVFPQTFEKSGKFLEEGAVLKIRGRLDTRGSVLVDKMERLR
jgi:DNA polymerase III alpha subunit